MDHIINFLTDYIKQSNNTYCNTINATHLYPCGICKKNKIPKSY